MKPVVITPIKAFRNESHFSEIENKLELLVISGRLKNLGLISNNSPSFVTKYLDTVDDSIWLLAIPDQAFRGYLKQQC